MSEAAASIKKKIQVSVEEGGSGEVIINGMTVAEISPDGNVVTFMEARLEKPAAAAEAAATQDKQISIGKDFNTVAMYGAKVELATDGSLIVYTNGTLKVKPAPANDTAIKVAKDTLELGTQMSDGSVYAGLAADGKLILAMPADLDVTMTFNDAAKAVAELNAEKVLGHDDWQIPSLKDLSVLQKTQNEGALKGTFKTAVASGSDCPYWYWSSTQNPDYSSDVYTVRFSDGYQLWDHKNNFRLSCRPVRLVAASVAPAPG